MVSGRGRENTFVDMLYSRLDLPGNSILEYALPGFQARNARDWMEHLLTGYDLPETKTMIFWMGVNDIMHDRYEIDPDITYPADPNDPMWHELRESLGALIGMAQRKGYNIIICTYYYFLATRHPCYLRPIWPITKKKQGYLDTYVDLMNRSILEVAGQYGLDVAKVDGLGRLMDDEDNYYDCVHASEQGYELITNVIQEVLESASPGPIDDDDEYDDDDDDFSDGETNNPDVDQKTDKSEGVCG